MFVVLEVVENGAGAGHWAKGYLEARDRPEAKDQLRWVLHCLLPSLGCDVLPLVASPFAVEVAPAMALAVVRLLRVPSCEP